MKLFELLLKFHFTWLKRMDNYYQVMISLWVYSRRPKFGSHQKFDQWHFRFIIESSISYDWIVSYVIIACSAVDFYLIRKNRKLTQQNGKFQAFVYRWITQKIDFFSENGRKNLTISKPANVRKFSEFFSNHAIGSKYLQNEQTHKRMKGKNVLKESCTSSTHFQQKKVNFRAIHDVAERLVSLSLAVCSALETQEVEVRNY